MLNGTIFDLCSTRIYLYVDVNCKIVCVSIWWREGPSELRNFVFSFFFYIFWTHLLLILFNDPILRFSWRLSWTPDWRLCRWVDWDRSWYIPAWLLPGRPRFLARCRESILYWGRPEYCRWKMEPSKPGNSLKRIHINYGDGRIRFKPKVLKEIFFNEKSYLS